MKLSTTEDTEDAEEILGFLRVLRVLCGGELSRDSWFRAAHNRWQI